MTLLFAAGVVAWLPGCGGSSTPKTSSIAAATPAEALEAAKTAAAGASSVTIHETSSQGRGKFSLDLQLNRQGGKGKIDLLGMEFDVIRLGQTVYVKGPPSLYTQLRIKKQIPNGTWVKIVGQNSLATLTSLTSETTRILPNGSSETKGTATLQGQPVVELRSEGKQKGRLYVKATGVPFPLKLEKRGHEIAQIDFTGWNQPVSITAPARATSSAG